MKKQVSIGALCAFVFAVAASFAITIAPDAIAGEGGCSCVFHPCLPPCIGPDTKGVYNSQTHLCEVGPCEDACACD